METGLTEDDIKYLNVTFETSWEIKKEQNEGLIFQDYLLPPGYNINKVELMILIPNEYPMAALDMFYIYPEINRLDGKDIEALAQESHFGKNWQRWSRHYNWQPGVHNLSTHLVVVKNSLKQELKK